MVQFRIRLDESRIYEVYDIHNDDYIDESFLNLLANNQIPCMVKTSLVQNERSMAIEYDITSLIRVSDKMKKITRDEVFKIFRSVLKGVSFFENNGFNMRYLIFTPENIFWNIYTQEVLFICLPVKELIESHNYIEFFDRMMISSNFEQSEDNKYVEKIKEFLKSGNAHSPFYFSKFLDSLESECKTSEINTKKTNDQINEDKRKHRFLFGKASKKNNKFSQRSGRKEEKESIVGAKDNTLRKNDSAQSTDANNPFAISGYGLESDVSDEKTVLLNTASESSVVIRCDNTQSNANGVETEIGDERTVLITNENPIIAKSHFLVRKKTNEKKQIDASIFRIGRDGRKNDFVVEDNMHVGRVHCHIVVRNNECYVIDDSSMNHTFIDGEQILPGKEYRISNGQTLRLGDEEFEFKEI